MATDASGASSEAAAGDLTLAPPVLPREIAAITLWTLFADLLIFRTYGFSGPGLFFALVPLLFFVGYPGLRRGLVWRLTVKLGQKNFPPADWAISSRVIPGGSRP